MRINLKKEKAITLIALVITIIILIILAGVAINLTIGENGIFNKAKEAKEDYKVAANEEQEELSNVEGSIDVLAGGSTQYASYDKPYIPTGFKHKEGEWNNGYTIIGDTTSIGDEFVWVPCVTDQSKVKPRDTVVTFGKTVPSTTDTTDPYYMYNSQNFGLLPTDSTVPAEDASVEEIEESVGKYGGFYIAKYEAGIEGTTDNYNLTERKPYDGSYKPLSQPGKGVWSYIMMNQAITVSKAMIDQTATGAKSTLISGAAWDTTLQWMVSASDNKDANAGYDINPDGKGNYGESFSTTGYYAVNNIYDMAGNYEERTTERGAGSLNIVRGGYYFPSSSENPAAFRNSAGGYSYRVGFRVVLYK